jgi:hypothetical protein
MSLKTILEEDLVTFFNIDEFAEEVIYYLGAVSTPVVIQFFDEESDLGDSMFRKILVKVADLPTLSREGYFLIGGEKYGVIDFFPDEQNLINNVLTQKGMK